MRVHTAKNLREVKEGNIYIPYNAVSHKIRNGIFFFLKNVQMSNGTLLTHQMQSIITTPYRVLPGQRSKYKG